ncbi:tetratricopeptide repeat protein [Segetibacter sp. 3557_3]|uniref:tetratricopeptide repeat protein n=1 Tax=Segetibacter sp. 3557_3 TaxID=2547429 RepID=UPI00105869FD|nr:tetratricopeptide repeat protein [Segetibacter sp. 3557_3]TDH29214.1 tetratricopeptide repeat protein [Segetibacter sp. 3557_3]
MVNIHKKLLLSSALALATIGQVNAQATKTNNDPDADFKLAKELYQKEQYSLAYPLFKNILYAPAQQSNLPLTVKEEARFYTIVTGLKLNETAAESAAKDFINLEYNTPRNQVLSYHLGEYYFRKQNFTEANAYYEKAGISNLSNREIADVKFHQAYGYFTTQDFAQAKPMFNAIRQIPTDPNYLDANYYYGFISFYDKNYKEALASFRKVENEPTYQKIVPYYIAEILYFNGETDKAIQYAEESLKKGGQYYDIQLQQLLGHAYFQKKEYQKAQPYLANYVSKAEKVRREDLYELAYTYYETKQLDKAITGFKELGGKEDSLAQNSMYLLADSYLKTNQKANARSAFLFSASNSSNAVQKEISQFNYAKLSFELGFPDVAATELQTFIGQYPSSTYNAEARELLVSVLASTNNYREAITLYESLPVKSETSKRIYPRILYGRAVELVNDQQIEKADDLFTRILTLPYNEQQLPFTNFWKGEIAYRINNFDQAIEYLNLYLKNPSSNGEVNSQHARYNLAYAYMQKENYTQALSLFEQISRSLNTASTPVEQDAFLRSADAYFMTRNYKKALDMYDAVIRSTLPSADYALYQKALISGAANRSSEKITLLRSLEQRFPNSGLVTDANLEIANTFLGEENFREAITPLNKIIAVKNSPYLPQAYLKLGIAYFNLENNRDALDNFKKLISAFPNSAESDDAVEYVRNIFIDDQKPQDFVEFMKQSGKNVSYGEEDSLTYASANNRYENNDVTNAQSGFTAYLSKFPEGRYAIDASFNLAEIYNGKKDFTNALKGYSYVASKAPNKYAERGVLQAARINFFEVKDYSAAENLYNQLKSIATSEDTRLESMRGLLRSQYRLNKWNEAVPNAQELLTQKSIATDDRIMANMVLAKSYHAKKDIEAATGSYRTVIGLGKSEFAAEARYQLAAILFDQGKFADAEKAAFDVVNKAGSYEYWTTKAYILLGDIYWKQKDYFNAEATFKSVAENATISELKEEAQAKLKSVVAEKSKGSKLVE